MDTTIRNIDEETYRALKARSALTGKTIGEVLTEAIRSYLAQPRIFPKRGSLRDWVPERYPKGNKHLSKAIDKIAYGL